MKAVISARNIAIYLCIFSMSLSAGTSSYASAEKADGRACFIKGKHDLDEGRYAEAVTNLSISLAEFPLLADYSLLYLAQAYHELGDHRKSLDTVRSLLTKYPSSPLVKKARLAEIREAKDASEQNLKQFYAAYVRDFPDDGEVGLLYGFFLRQAGESAEAQAVFKKIYLRAGASSHSAYAELGPGEVSAADLNERAENLMKGYAFNEAESDLRKALAIDDGKHREEILRNLGQALFRQKEYREAAVMFAMGNDLYSKARSLYRAGDKEGFNSALQELTERNDKKAGYLLAAAASDKRREKEFEGALKIYSEVLNNYPAEAEEALWGIGWTCYLSGEYKKAAETFSKLFSRYSDPKYLYWQARSVEMTGEDAGELYRTLITFENNFYGAISFARYKGAAARPVAEPGPVSGPQASLRKFERVEALASLNMTKEALSELISISKKVETPHELVYVISRFQEFGEYRRAIGLATRVPYSEKLHRFWYPLAFWDEVEKIARKNDLDPMVALSVMREESRFDADARSVSGARGLMQIMPQTAYRLDRNLKLGIQREAQINNVRNNISLGTFYLKTLFREFKTLAPVLAAYNAGEFIVREWEQKGNYKAFDEFIEDIPYAETRNYVKKVITSYFQYKRLSLSATSETGIDMLLGKL